MDGKTAVVTGAAAGLGYAVGEALASAGAHVYFVDLQESGERKVRELCERGLSASFIRADFASEPEVEKAFRQAEEERGRLDVLVNNIGMYPRAMLEETSLELWDRVMRVNLTTMFLSCKHGIPLMRKSGGGAIVNLSSSHSRVGLPELFAYSVSKGGVDTLTRNLAGAHAKDRIRVNAVNPGWVLTEKELAERRANGQTADWVIERGKSLPLGRLQTVEDTANAVLFLTSDYATQITGQVLHIDGGKEVATLFDDRSRDTGNT